MSFSSSSPSNYYFCQIKLNRQNKKKSIRQKVQEGWKFQKRLNKLNMKFILNKLKDNKLRKKKYNSRNKTMNLQNLI